MTWVDGAYADPIAMGDVLADFLEAGGNVILGQGCVDLGDPGQQHALGGRIMVEYCPIAADGLGVGSYAGDGAALHNDVLNYATQRRDNIAYIAPDAIVDGHFNDGPPSVAYACEACAYGWCDLNHDGVIDLQGDFYATLYPALGSEPGDAAWLPTADWDEDSRITLIDYQAWRLGWIAAFEFRGTLPGCVFYSAGNTGLTYGSGDWAILTANMCQWDCLGSYGACCDSYGGDCSGYVEFHDCVAPAQWTKGATCDELDPPCGNLGCCCDDDTGTVSTEFELSCSGRFLAGVVGEGCTGDAFIPPCGTLEINFVFDPLTGPAPETLGECFMYPFAPDERSLYEPVMDAPSPCPTGGGISFDDWMLHRRVGLGWGNWSHDYLGDVYITQARPEVTITLPADSCSFYFYVQPNNIAPHEFQITVNGFERSAPFTVEAATYVGITCSGPFLESVRIVNTDGEAAGFAVGEFGICCSCVPLYGACCNPFDGTCVDETALADCQPPQEFHYLQMCGQLDPPCGNIGCCCYENMGEPMEDFEANCAGRFLPGVVGEGCVPSAFDPVCGAYHPCNHYLRLFAGRTTGWEGNYLDLYVNGQLVLAGATLEFTTGGLLPFPAETGDVITTVFTVVSESVAETCSYWIYDAHERPLGHAGPGDLTVYGRCEETGSCCDSETGNCEDNVSLAECPEGRRFTPGVSCDYLSPPCGGIDISIVFADMPTEPPPTFLCGERVTRFQADDRPLFQMVEDVPSPCATGGVIAFSTPQEHLRVGNGWETWSHGYAGDVYFAAEQTEVTLSVPAGISAFYFYIEPLQSDAPSLFTVTVNDVIASQPFEVLGGGGASFVGVCGEGIETIKIVNTDGNALGFALGEFGLHCGVTTMVNESIERWNEKK